MKDLFKSTDLNLLRIFEALIQEGNVTRAAERLCLTQPAVSNALARLRDTFNDALFEKTRGGMLPTATARELWATLEPHYQGLREVLTPQSFDPAVYSGTIRIAMTDFTMERVMPRLAKFLQRQAPNMSLEVSLYSLADTPSMLDKGSVDIAIGTVLEDFSQRGSIKTHPLWQIDFSLLMRRGHKLASGKKISVQKFLCERHIDVRTQNMQKGVYDQILLANGLKRQLVLTVPSFQQALAVIAVTDCIAMLPNSLIAQGPFAKSLVAIQAPIAQPSRDLRVIWHERFTEVPAHAWMRHTLISMFSND